MNSKTTTNHSLFAYVGCRTTKERFARGKGLKVLRYHNNEWEDVQLIKDIVNPSYLAFDHNYNFLYVVHGDYSEISSYKIDKQSGEISFLNTKSTGGKNPVHLLVDNTNNYIVVANYITGSLSVLPINDDGSLDNMSDLYQISNENIIEGKDLLLKQGVSHPHQVLFNKNKNQIIVPDLGLNQLLFFNLNHDGTLSPSSSQYCVQMRTGSGPRHCSIHPFLPYIYVANELDTSVEVLYDNQTQFEIIQSVTTLDVSSDKDTVAAIAISNNGRFLYVSNRGTDSITVFSINEETGKLKKVDNKKVLGKTPRFITLDPSGEYLYVANEDSDTIHIFEIDELTGKLNMMDNVIETESPVCLLFKKNI